MNRVPAALFAVLFATLCSLPAAASVRSEGAKIRWVGELPDPVRPGQDVRGRFEVVAARPGLLENVRIEGSGWTVQPIRTGGSRMVMARGQRREIEFVARPSREDEPLVVTAMFDGHEIRETVRLDAASLAQTRARRPLVFGDGAPRVEGARPHGATTTAFHFTGRIAYMRGDVPPVEIGADHIVVRIKDEDAVIDEVIWQGETDLNGYFDVHVDWDDCDISGCDDPDIYVEVVASNAVVDVQTPDVFEATITWESSVMNDFTGNTIAFGTMKPASDQYGAFAAYTDIIRAARRAALYGMSPPRVECEWPSDDTAYSRDFQEIYLEGAESFNEGAVAHEFGHHLHFHYGNLPVSNYANGYCDDPTPSHCTWCPENDQDGFKEGWANWFASTVLRSYQANYGVVPFSINDSRMLFESTSSCVDNGVPRGTWPGPSTEGYVSAVLLDIEDAQNDDHDGGAQDCHMDVLSLDADEIMAVFRDKDPTTLGQFLSYFRTDYPQYDQDLWSTLYNVWPGFAFTLEAPKILSQPPSCMLRYPLDPVTLSVSGNGSLLQYQWRRNGAPLANGTGVTGATTKNLALVLGSNSGGSYDCVIKTCDGTLSVTSTATRITMLELTNATSLLSWGENQTYQVGDGTNTLHVPPYLNPNITDVIQVDGGRGFTIALRADGQVFTWGDNSKGQCGIGSTDPFFRTSAGTSLMSGAIQVAAGQNHAMAINGAGQLAAWGDNFRGQIGDGTRIQRESPVPVDIGGCVIAVSCGQTHTIALRSDGVVYSWGLNSLSALGRGAANEMYPTPAAIPGLTNVVAISAAGFTNLALKNDGTVWAWGSNQNGLLGIGSAAQDVLTPTRINGLPAIRSITAGYFASFAVGTDGSVWSWGLDSSGLLGTGAPIGSRNVPGSMLLSNPKRIVCGEGGWAAALMGDRKVKVWGNNADWITGSTSPLSIYDPIYVPGIVRASAIGAGHATLHACGFKEDAIVGAPGGDSPIDLALAASPNPSVGRTRLAFDLPRAGHVTLAIYDLAGRRVRLLVDGMREPGRYDETWDGRADVGSGRAAGVYFARLQVGGETLTERIVRIR